MCHGMKWEEWKRLKDAEPLEHEEPRIEVSKTPEVAEPEHDRERELVEA